MRPLTRVRLTEHLGNSLLEITADFGDNVIAIEYSVSLSKTITSFLSRLAANVSQFTM